MSFASDHVGRDLEEDRRAYLRDLGYLEGHVKLLMGAGAPGAHRTATGDLVAIQHKVTLLLRLAARIEAGSIVHEVLTAAEG